MGGSENTRGKGRERLHNDKRDGEQRLIGGGREAYVRQRGEKGRRER